MPTPPLAHHDGLIRGMSVMGTAVPVVWLVTDASLSCQASMGITSSAG